LDGWSNLGYGVWSETRLGGMGLVLQGVGKDATYGGEGGKE